MTGTRQAKGRAEAARPCSTGCTHYPARRRLTTRPLSGPAPGSPASIPPARGDAIRRGAATPHLEPQRPAGATGRPAAAGAQPTRSTAGGRPFAAWRRQPENAVSHPMSRPRPGERASTGRSTSPDQPSACPNRGGSPVPGAIPVRRAVRRMSGLVAAGIPRSCTLPVSQCKGSPPSCPASRPVDHDNRVNGIGYQAESSLLIRLDNPGPLARCGPVRGRCGPAPSLVALLHQRNGAKPAEGPEADTASSRRSASTAVRDDIRMASRVAPHKWQGAHGGGSGPPTPACA